MSDYITGSEVVGRSNDGYTCWVESYLHDAKPMSKEDVHCRRMEGVLMHHNYWYWERMGLSIDSPPSVSFCLACGKEHLGLCTTPLIEHEDGTITGGDIIENSP